jgi:hypothetical protein
MKTYTDAAQLPLAATVRKLPSFDDTQIDTQTLVKGGQFVSPPVIGLKQIKVGKTVGNIGENHEESRAVTTGQKNGNGGERGIRTPHFPTHNKGNPHNDTQIDSQISVSSSHDLSRIVTAWSKLPAPLKAAILAIVNSAEGQS